MALVQSMASIFPRKSDHGSTRDLVVDATKRGEAHNEAAEAH